jgi:trans-aconitate methyltransferase
MDLKETGSSIQRHPWEISRTDCLMKSLQPHIDLNESTKRIADIGCGDMYFTNLVAESFNGSIFAVDNGFPDEIEIVDDKITKINDLAKIENNSVHIAVLMDVLEHIEDTAKFLRLLSDKLTSDGICLITVPAFQHLFSEHDRFLRHFRRYNRKLLKSTLTSSGFKIERMHYFYSSLYVLRLIQHVISKLQNKQDKMVNNITMWNDSIESGKTKALRGILNFDYAVNALLGNVSFFGLSLFAVCRKTAV